MVKFKVDALAEILLAIHPSGQKAEYSKCITIAPVTCLEPGCLL